MLSKEMIRLGTQRSVIREIFEYGRRRAAIVGKENVHDFSIGNPNVPAPKEVQEAILAIVQNESPVTYHSYTSSPGADETREAIANSLNRRFDTSFSMKNLFITCGAAASLNICLKAMTASNNDEYIVFAPYFTEYKFFIEAAGGKFVMIPADTENFQIDFTKFEKAINKNTKAVLINSPNNPSGVVYTEETIKKLAAILKEKSKEYGKIIYLISDEPYRELVYGNTAVPFVTKYYDNAIVCYSYSKSLSLPGERIGYVLIPSEVENFEEMFAAVAGSARILGYVCAPSLFQRVITRCVDVVPDLTIYERNRNLLNDSLTEMGYHVAKPDGAFYLFFAAPDGDALAFCEKAKEHDLLLVPGDGFGCPGYMRLSYCVQTEQIERALPILKKLI